MDPMTMMMLGGGLSAAGGIMGATSGNRAARQSRDWYGDRTNEGAQRYGGMVFGQGYDGRYGPTPGQLGGPSLMSMQHGLAAWNQGQQGQIMGRYNSDASQVDQLYAGNEGLAADYGAGAEKLIDEDAGRALTGANRMSRAALTASGFGASTAVGNQMSNNARNIGRDATRSKLGVRMENTDRRMGARSQRAGFLGDAGRGRAGLAAGFLDQGTQLRQQPINLAMSTMGSNIMNPWLNKDTSSFYPGYSGLGSAASGVGNSMAQMGMMDYMGQQGHYRPRR
jgi:hypothetical protein